LRPLSGDRRHDVGEALFAFKVFTVKGAPEGPNYCTLSKDQTRLTTSDLRLAGVPQLIPPIVHETYGICRKKAPHGANTACIYAEREAGTPSGGRRKLRDAGRLG